MCVNFSQISRLIFFSADSTTGKTKTQGVNVYFASMKSIFKKYFNRKREKKKKNRNRISIGRIRFEKRTLNNLR